MPKEVFRTLQKVRVGGQQLQISLALRTQAEKLRREFVPQSKRAPDAKRGKRPPPRR
jgi:type II secretory pathway component PulL